MRRSAVVLLALLAGCTSRCESKTKTDVRTLVFGTTTDPKTIDPAFVRSSGAQEMARLAFLELTEFDAQWRVVPRLAAGVPTASTATVGHQVRWRLKEGYGWSDGRPVTSADVVFGHSIENNPGLEVVSHDVARRVRIRAEGEQGFEATFTEPYPHFAAPKVHAILPGHAYPKPTGANFVGLGRASIANGPYVPVEWKAGQYVRFDRNEHFGGPRPAIDRIIFRFFASEDALEAELLTGGIDALGEASGLSLDRAKGVEARLADSHVVTYTDSGLWLHLIPRLDHPVLGQLEVRKAIAQIIDRNVVTNLVYGGHARPAFGLFPPRHPAFDPAGVKRPSNVSCTPCQGVELSLQYTGTSQGAARGAAYIQTALRKIGFEVKLVAQPFEVLYGRLKKGEHPPLTLFALRMRPDWDGAAVLAKDGRLNFSGFADPIVEAAIDRAEVTVDPTAWAQTLATVERRFREALPLIPLAYRQTVSVRPKKIQGWSPTGTTTPVTYNAETWR